MKTKLIVDTSSLVKIINSNNTILLKRILSTKNTLLIVSEELYNEYKKVLSSDKLKNLFDSKDTSRILTDIKFKASWIKLDQYKTKYTIRDSNDLHLVNLFFKSDADYIVTDDKDFLTSSIPVKKQIKFKDWIHLNKSKAN
jgi:putative PIN family toxin of toxin-antitoxin system